LIREFSDKLDCIQGVMGVGTIESQIQTTKNQQNLNHKKMMTEGTPLSVELKGFSDRPTPGEVRLQVWDSRARMVRALQYLGMIWGLAVVTAFVPGVHFVLVPVFFMAGPIVAWGIYRQERAILGGQGVCPDCGVTLVISKTLDHWPISDLCNHCYRGIKIMKSEIAN
jgi:hypothetical protein